MSGLYDLKVFSDGEKMVVVAGGRGYVLNQAFLTNFSVSMNRNFMDVTSFGSDRTERIATSQVVTLDLSVQGAMMDVKEGDEVFKEAQVQAFTKKINKAVQSDAFKRSIEF